MVLTNSGLNFNIVNIENMGGKKTAEIRLFDGFIKV